MKTLLNEFLSRIELGEPQQFKNLVIVPIFKSGNGGPEYLTLSEGLTGQLVSITELHSARTVPQVKVTNLAEALLLPVDGEVDSGRLGQVPNPGQARGLAGWKRTCWLLGQLKTSMKTTKALFGILNITLALSAGTAQAGFSLSTTSGAYVVIPHDASLNPTNNMLTVECWFNRQALPSGYDTWSSLVSKEPYGSTFSGFDLRFANVVPNADIDLSPRSVYDNYIYAHNQGNHQPTGTNKWQHYAMQYDGTNYLVWVDGSLFFSTNCTAQIVIGSNPIHIGCQNSGWIAEVRVSSIARYSTPFIPQTRLAPDTNMLALYHFDEGQGTSVADSSGNGNNGTIQGSRAWSSQVPNFPYLSLVKAVKPAFSNLALGTNYQLQVSADLSSWTNQGSRFTATNDSVVYSQYWDVDNWSQLFFRLQVSP